MQWLIIVISYLQTSVFCKIDLQGPRNLIQIWRTVHPRLFPRMDLHSVSQVQLHPQLVVPVHLAHPDQATINILVTRFVNLGLDQHPTISSPSTITLSLRVHTTSTCKLMLMSVPGTLSHSSLSQQSH